MDVWTADLRRSNSIIKLKKSKDNFKALNLTKHHTQTQNSNNSKNKTSKTVEKNKTTTASSPSKNITSTKSASQLSISHFSSVSTPEYREGWDRIWGNNKLNLNRDKVINDKKTWPVEISLSNLDLSDLTKKTILKKF